VSESAFGSIRTVCLAAKNAELRWGYSLFAWREPWAVVFWGPSRERSDDFDSHADELFS